MTSQVSFFFKSLCISAICSGKEFPIDIFGAFARIIDFMLSKFGGESVKGTFVHTRNKPLYHLIGQKLQVLERGNFIEMLLDFHVFVFIERLHRIWLLVALHLE